MSVSFWQNRVYGLKCPFVYNHWRVIIWTKNSFKFPSIEKEGNLCSKKEEIWRKKLMCPHVGNCAESTKTRLNHRGLLVVPLRPISWSSLGTYGFALPSPTTVSTGSCPPSQHIASRLACHMRPCVLIEKAWWKVMKQNVWWHYIWKQFVWYSALTDYMNMCWLPQSMSQCM